MKNERNNRYFCIMAIPKDLLAETLDRRPKNWAETQWHQVRAQILEAEWDSPVGEQNKKKSFGKSFLQTAYIDNRKASVRELREEVC